LKSSLEYSNQPQIIIRVHPCRNKPGQTILLSAFLLAAAWLFARLFNGIQWGVLALLMFLLSLRSYFFPREYKLDETGITLKTFWSRKVHSWEKFRSYKIYSQGIYLSPLADPERFDRYRGIYLILDEEQKLQVKDLLELYIGRA